MSTRTVDTRTEIETPEGVLLAFDLAGPGSRAGAYSLDLLLRIGIGYGLVFLLGLLMPFLGALPFGIVLVGFFLLEWGYGAFFEGFWNGQTPGKKAYKLQVVKDAGYPISFYDAVLRNLLRAADILPIGYGAGLITMCATKRMQRIGDLAAGTIVVRTERQAFQRDTTLFADARVIERNECNGVYQVSERTLDLIEQIFVRSKSVGARRVDEISAHVARPLAERLGFDIDHNPPRHRHREFLRCVVKTFGSVDDGTGDDRRKGNRSRPQPRRHSLVERDLAKTRVTGGGEASVQDRTDDVTTDDVDIAEDVFLDELPEDAVPDASPPEPPTPGPSTMSQPGASKSAPTEEPS